MKRFDETNSNSVHVPKCSYDDPKFAYLEHADVVNVAIDINGHNGHVAVLPGQTKKDVHLIVNTTETSTSRNTQRNFPTKRRVEKVQQSSSLSLAEFEKWTEERSINTGPLIEDVPGHDRLDVL